MTVSKLISILQTLPPDESILIKSHYGAEDLLAENIKRGFIALDANWEGSHYFNEHINFEMKGYAKDGKTIISGILIERNSY